MVSVKSGGMSEEGERKLDWGTLYAFMTNKSPLIYMLLFSLLNLFFRRLK
jgi:hypothetical protein